VVYKGNYGEFSKRHIEKSRLGYYTLSYQRTNTLKCYAAYQKVANLALPYLEFLYLSSLSNFKIKFPNVTYASTGQVWAGAIAFVDDVVLAVTVQANSNRCCTTARNGAKKHA
jgi:hypothetical protein